jgi:hypothetical protein
MEELVQLIRLIKKKKISDKFILKSGFEVNKQDILFHAIKKNEVENDSQAIKLLYGNEYSKHTYNRLKRRLKEKLYNSLVTLDQNKQKYTSHKKANYKVLKMFVVANMLKLENQNYLMVSVLEDTLRRALKYEFTEYVKLITKLLIHHFSIRSRDNKKLKKYQSIYKKYSEIEMYEFKAQMYYNELSRLYIESSTSKSKYIKLLIKYSKELEDIQKDIKSFEFNHKSFSIHSTKHILLGDYSRAINNADQALKFFETKPFETKRSKFTFNSDKIISFILTGNFDEASQLIEKTLKILSDSSFNYFRIQFYKFQNYSLNRKYEELPLIVNQVLNTKGISKYNIQYELWKIRDAYTKFLIEADVILNCNIQNSSPFRIAKFLNEVPIFSKEKRGMNVAILVIQILFMLTRKKYNDVIDRVDALKQYSFRYLRNDETFRSNCFIKMLILIPKSNFHPVRVQLHAKNLFTKLKKHEISIQEFSSEIEIIPFDHLWEIIVELLKKNLSK